MVALELIFKIIVMKNLKKIKSVLASFLTIILIAPMILSSCSANDENLINDNVAEYKK
jgi:hypothetical protein